ncbi:hypothetical protein IWW57_005032, partial [Coemansia sp. S610]
RGLAVARRHACRGRGLGQRYHEDRQLLLRRHVRSPDRRHPGQQSKVRHLAGSSGEDLARRQAGRPKQALL